MKSLEIFILFLGENNIAAPIPIKSLSGQHYIKIKIPVKASANQFYKQHIVRILEFQPGVVLKEITKSYSTFYKLGIFIGHLNKVLKV